MAFIIGFLPGYEEDPGRYVGLLWGWAEIAASLRVCEKTAKKLVKLKGLPIHHVGRHVYAYEDELHSKMKRD